MIHFLHQVQWWYLPAVMVLQQAWGKFLNWIVNDDGKWRWQR